MPNHNEQRNLCGFYVVILNHSSVRPIKLKGGYARAIMCYEIMAGDSQQPPFVEMSAKQYCNMFTFCLEN